MRLDFASDNVAAIAPEAMETIAAHNRGYDYAYGADADTKRAADLLRELFDCDAEIHFVSSGTAANGISLATMCRPFEAVAAHEHAHIFDEEAGALGFFGHGLGRAPLPGGSGKVDASALAALLQQPEPASTQPAGALSLSNATEYGVVYSQVEVATLTSIARETSLGVHLDGARLWNAAAAGFQLRDLKDMGIDILIAGGTKAGLPPSEAIVLLNPKHSRRFRNRLKQSGQLISKARFAAAGWIGMIESGALIQRAGHANAMAAALAAGLPTEPAHPVQTNAVFLRLDASSHQALLQAGWQCFRFADGSVRLMCSWSTTPEAVDELCEAVRGLS